MIEIPVRLGRPIGAAFICAALVLLVVSVYALAARALAQTSSRLEGRIFNGSAGVSPERVANLEVTLFQMGASGPVTRTVQTDALGHFSFADLQLDQNSPYFTRVIYEDFQYFSDILTPGVETSTPISLTVYETETVPANFQIDRAHFILDVNQRTLSGIELLQVKNTTDRAFMLPLPLPLNLSDFQFNDPRDHFRAVEGADGALAFPILPTTDQILLGVQMTASPPDYELKLQVPVKVGQMNVLVSQAGGVQVTSPQLTPGPVFTPQSGSSYWQLSGNNFPARTTVSVIISNLPGESNSTLARNLVLGLGGLASLALLVIPFIRRRRTQGSPPPFSSRERTEGKREEESPEGAKIGERLGQLEEIANLDDAFEAGEIPEDEYRAQRAALKADLMHDPDPQA